MRKSIISSLFILFDLFLILCSGESKKIMNPDDWPYWCRIIQPKYSDTLKINQEYELIAEFSGFTKPVTYGYSHTESLHNPYYRLDDTMTINRIYLHYSFADTGWHRIILRVQSEVNTGEEISTSVMVNVMK